MFYYTYKTTCTITGKYYVGMHSTKDIGKPYYGSGTLIKRSLSKYGRKNHVVEILQMYNSRDELIQAEKQLVTTNLIDDPMCMNLMEGGQGGFDEDRRDKSLDARRKLLQDPAYREAISITNAQNGAKVTNQGRLNCAQALREKYANDPEFKQKQAESALERCLLSHQKRKEKEDAGWVWVKRPENGRKRKLISPEMVSHYLTNGWIIGRVGRC